MYRNTVPARQLATWLCAALIPPLIQMSANLGWATAGAISLVCNGVVFAVWKWGLMSRHPVFACVKCLYIIVLLWSLLPYAAASWPGNHDPAVPLILLALAAWSANKGAAAAARVGCVLFWIVLLIYLGVLASGTPQIKPSWLKPTFSPDLWPTVALLLSPCTVLMLHQEGKGWSPRLLLPGVILTAAAAVTAGILSPKLTETITDPFYTAVKSLTLLGVAQHFEAILSAAMTVGWFCLMALLLSASGAYAQTIKPGWERKGLWLTAGLSALGLLCKLHIFW